MMFGAAGSGREFEFVIITSIFLRAFLPIPEEGHLSRYLTKDVPLGANQKREEYA